MEVARIWRGWTSAPEAAKYEHVYSTVVAEELRRVHGFAGARLLRRHVDATDVEFVSIVYFTSMDAIRAFAGDEPDRAVISSEAAAVLKRFDEQVHHYEVVADLRGTDDEGRT